MRVTILTVGSRGDVQPFVAFGEGLARAGHEVRLATHPRFHALAARAMLELAPLEEGRLSQGPGTEEGRRWMESGSRRLPTWVGLVKDARSVARRRLADAVAACDGAEAIVASNLATLLGWQLSEQLGIPLVRALLTPPGPIMHGPARPAVAVVRQGAWLAAWPWLRSVRRDVGLRAPAVREPIGTMHRRRVPVLYPFSEAAVPRPPGAGARTVVCGYWFLDRDVDLDPPPQLVEFLAAGPPPVCIGFGSMLDADPRRTTELAIAALRRARRRGVLVAGQYGFAGGDLPADVVAVKEISYRWLFPQCAAVVHAGGAGTTALTLRAGVPSVAVPQLSDQLFWARSLHQLGVSAAPIHRRRLSAEGLAEAIIAVTGERAISDRAAALGRRIRAEDGVARAVGAFERYVGGRGLPNDRRAVTTSSSPAAG